MFKIGSKYKYKKSADTWYVNFDDGEIYRYLFKEEQGHGEVAYRFTSTDGENYEQWIIENHVFEAMRPFKVDNDEV